VRFESVIMTVKEWATGEEMGRARTGMTKRFEGGLASRQTSRSATTLLVLVLLFWAESSLY